MGARREVVSAVAERYRSAGRVEKGRILDELCADDGLASQACGPGVAAARRHRRETRGPRAAQRAIRRDDQGRTHGAVGSVRSRVRQAARGDDPDPFAGAGATRPIAARRRRAGAGARGERGDHRSDAGRREGCGSGRPSAACRLLLGDAS